MEFKGWLRASAERQISSTSRYRASADVRACMCSCQRGAHHPRAPLRDPSPGAPRTSSAPQLNRAIARTRPTCSCSAASRGLWACAPLSGREAAPGRSAPAPVPSFSPSSSAPLALPSSAAPPPTSAHRGRSESTASVARRSASRCLSRSRASVSRALVPGRSADGDAPAESGKQCARVDSGGGAVQGGNRGVGRCAAEQGPRRHRAPRAGSPR